MGIFKKIKNQKHKIDIKYNKEIFLNNIKYIIKYGVDPEISLYDKNGKEYFILAYENFVDYYDANDNYSKLNSVEELFEYINFDDIVEISGNIDYSKDVKDQSLIIDNKIWFNA